MTPITKAIPTRKPVGSGTDRCPPELERVAILKVLRAKAEQQQQKKAATKADQQKTKANQHSTTVDGLSLTCPGARGRTGVVWTVLWSGPVAVQRRWRLHLHPATPAAA